MNAWTPASRIISRNSITIAHLTSRNLSKNSFIFSPLTDLFHGYTTYSGYAQNNSGITNHPATKASKDSSNGSVETEVSRCHDREVSRAIRYGSTVQAG